MKRQIEFKFQDDRYFLEEDSEDIFSIKTSDLKFNSLAVYNGVYKDKIPAIELGLVLKIKVAQTVEIM